MSRKYEITHPWINFQFNMNKLDYRIWLLLGEAKSKCEHIKGAPMLPDTIKKFHNVYLAKGILATTAIEGNTLNEAEVEKRIKGELDLPPSKEYLGQEIDNVLKVINSIGKNIFEAQDVDDLEIDTIKDFNATILENLPLSEDVVPGMIRHHSVGVAGYRGAPAEDCEFLLERYVEWFNQDLLPYPDEKVIGGILKAILAHLYFVWIHPFGDGNGRTARLIEFQILLSSGIPAAAAHLLSNHYNATRTVYYQMLDKSSKNESAIIEFIRYALQGFIDGLKDEIETIQNEQMTVHWINHVHNRFKDKKLITDIRQRDVMLELTKVRVPEFHLEDIRHLTPKIAEMYAGKNEITIKRDLDDLQKMELLIFDKQQKKYEINFGILRQYLIVTPTRE